MEQNRIVINKVLNNQLDQAILELQALVDQIYQSIPPQKRISRGITWASEQAANLLWQESTGDSEGYRIATALFDTLPASNRLQGVPLYMLAEYGCSHVLEVMGFFEHAANSPDWVVKEFAQGAFRKVIRPNKEFLQPWLCDLAGSANPNLRRFASETLRPVAANKWLLREPDYSLHVLSLMFKESHPFPRTSVGNNLSDLSRHNPELVFSILEDLVASQDKNSAWIAYRACRNLVKKQPQRVMEILRVTEYHYKDRNFYRDDESTGLNQMAAQILDYLCNELPGRPVGSAGNRAATVYFAQKLAGSGFQVEQQDFECMDWQGQSARLKVAAQLFEVLPGPYTLGCQVEGRLVVAATLSELSASDLGGAILLLRGELTGEQLMPKNFPFYNPEEHQRIYRMLEQKAPLAVLAATTRDEQMAGAIYPFPLIEDGDFDIPNAYLTDDEGQRLSSYTGQTVSLEIEARRLPAHGSNVIGRRGSAPDRRVVVTAHIDAKLGTPGALDNASGVSVLLLLASLLSKYDGSLGVEIVALNGEDYYNAIGETEYLRRNQPSLDEIILNINLDGVGYRQGRSAFSLYECPASLAAQARAVLSAYPGLVEGEPWYQGDHSLFVMNQVPAMALTSEFVHELTENYVHTDRDRPVLVDPVRLVEIARALADLVVRMDS